MYFLLLRNIIPLIFKQQQKFVLLTLHGSRKYQYPPQDRLTEIHSREGTGGGGGGGICIGKNEVETKFPGGERLHVNLKTFLWEGYGYFLEQCLT